MNILYLGYWGAREGLSEATIYPHLKVLAQFPFIEAIYFLSIEREGNDMPLALGIEKVQHIPLFSRKSSSVLVNKTDDFIRFPEKINKLIKRFSIDLLICRSAPAGILGYLVHKKSSIPFWVESFEPHADYMLESGVWKKWDPRYWIQVLGEKLQLKHADLIFPVSEGYKNELVRKGVDKDFVVLPCTVDIPQFKWNSENRRRIRSRLGIAADANCGIYVGKFGGLYYEQESFEIFRLANSVFKKFFLIVLTPQAVEAVKQKLKEAGLEDKNFFVGLVPHEEVPAYMHAADFAFANIKPIQSQKFSSPIKTAEYWAAGLPFLLSKGVGDESQIIEDKLGGVLFNLQHIEEALVQMKQILTSGVVKTEYIELADKYRGRKLVKQAYEKAFNRRCISS